MTCAEAVGKGTPSTGALVSVKAGADGPKRKSGAKKEKEKDAPLYKRKPGKKERTGSGKKQKSSR